jgi:hypothetical protein
MKRHPKPFSVEIKRSRDPGQRSHLPPRRLFEATLVEATKIIRKEEPQAVAEPSAAPRIPPSIVEPVWGSSGPVEPVRRKRFSGKASPEQIELDLAATAAEDVMGAHAESPAIATTVLQTDVAPVLTEDTPLVHNAQSGQGESLTVGSRKSRRKPFQAVDAVTASKPEPLQDAEVIASSKTGERRLTKRLAAAVHLPRYERWKRRLHPASWKDHPKPRPN